MPEMSSLCQEGNGTPPVVFGARAQQVAPQDAPQNFYGQCGYPQPHSLPPPPPLQSHYSSEGYNSFQSGQADHQHQMEFHHHHHLQQYQQQQHQQQQHHQQFPPHVQHQHHWGYGMNGGEARGGSGEDWGHGYYFHQSGAYHAQNPYGYQYRVPGSHHPQHPGMDYGSSLPMTGNVDRHDGEEGSASPNSGEEDGVDAPGCGPNNQGAKSLRPPYEWMKPSPALPQPGHASVSPGKTRTKDKYRVVYSDHQRLELEKEFHFSKYITIRRKAEIAGQLGLSERQVKIWFQNRRAKERKQNKKREDQTLASQPGQGNGINGEGVCKADGVGGNGFIGDGPINPNMNGHHLDQHQTSLDQHHHIHQHMAINSTQQEDNHAHALIPKLEIKEEDMSVKQEQQQVASHNGAPLIQGPYLQATSSPQATPTAMTNHASLRIPPNMSTPTNHHANYHNHGMLGRNLQHARGVPTMDRFHSPNGNFVSSSTPTAPGTDEIAYRMVATCSADSSGNSMNLSGSSDSGIMS